MKPNLADFPTWNRYASEKDKRQYPAKVEQWKQDFEKEIRAIIWACVDQPIQGENTRIHLQSRIETLREILGEEPE